MSHQPIYEFGNYRLDVAERLLLREGESVLLQPKVFDLLLVLVEQHGHLVGKDELMKLVWPDTIVEEANLTNNISILRKTLGENGERFIATVPKRGYRFVAEVQVESAERTELGNVATLPVAGEARSEALSSPVKQHRKIALLRLVVSVLVVGGLAFGLYQLITRSRTKSISPEPKLIPLTSLPGRESQPTFSPDGNQLAFVWRNEKDSDIYVKLVDAETRLQLTNDPADEISPAWSPDGSSIAFLRRTPEGNGVYVVPAIGGAERKVGIVFAEVSWPSFLHWSPDGSALLVEDKASPQEPFGIFSLSIKTGDKQRLTSPPSGVYGDFNATYSPDGKTIAYSRVTSWNAADLYLLPAVGGEVRRLTQLNRAINGFAWTPNSSEIIFSSSTSPEDAVLMKVSVPRGTPERLSGSGQGISEPALHGRETVWPTRNPWKTPTPGVMIFPGLPKRIRPRCSSLLLTWSWKPSILLTAGR